MNSIMRKWARRGWVFGGGGDDDGCVHGDHSEDSDADSPDTDAGGDGGGEAAE